jgi:hypothetical protein
MRVNGMNKDECWIGTADDEWLKLEGCNVNMSISRRMQRTVMRGGEGDDLEDEGAESAEYTISGNMDIETYRQVMGIFRAGQPHFQDPIEERRMKVVFSSISYSSENGEYTFKFIEDCDDQAAS